jgi:hypothetical protein
MVVRVAVTLLESMILQVGSLVSVEMRIRDAIKVSFDFQWGEGDWFFSSLPKA